MQRDCFTKQIECLVRGCGSVPESPCPWVKGQSATACMPELPVPGIFILRASLGGVRGRLKILWPVLTGPLISSFVLVDFAEETKWLHIVLLPLLL